MNSNKPATEKSATDRKMSINNSKKYFWTNGRTHNYDHTSPACNHPKEGHQVGATLENRMEGSGKYYKKDKTHE